MKMAQGRGRKGKVEGQGKREERSFFPQMEVDVRSSLSSGSGINENGAHANWSLRRVDLATPGTKNGLQTQQNGRRWKRQLAMHGQRQRGR